MGWIQSLALLAQLCVIARADRVGFHEIDWSELKMPDMSNIMADLRIDYEAQLNNPSADCVARRNVDGGISNEDWFKNQRVFLHGRGKDGAVGWYGEAFNGVQNGSCNFLTKVLDFPEETVDAILNQKVFVTPGQIKVQCSNKQKNRWSVKLGHECWYNNFGMLLNSEEDCEQHSQDADVVDNVTKPGGRRCRGMRCITKSTYKDILNPMVERFGGALKKVLPPSPYIVYGKNAFVGGVNAVMGAGTNHMVETDGERFSTACSPYWQANTKNAVGSRNVNQKPFDMTIKETFAACASETKECPFPRYDKVFHISQTFHDQVFHFMVEGFPRIGPFLPILLANKEIMIYADPTKDGTAEGMHAAFFEMIGISRDRLIHGTAFAREVLIPQVGYSHNPLLNMWSLYSLRISLTAQHGVRKNEDGLKNILIIRRDSGRRMDAGYFSDEMANTLLERLPGYKVTIFKSSNHTLMHCLLCQIKHFQAADVVIGAHGAGMSHIQWMKPGTMVFETVHGGDSMIYGELSFMFGVKYFGISQTHSPKSIADLIAFAAD